MWRNVKSLLAAILTVLAAGCGSDRPEDAEDALEAFADAITDQDDRAALAVTCEASHDHITGTLSDPFRDNPMGVDVYAVEPGLRDMHYEAEAGDIVEENGSTATGTVDIAVEDVPEDLPPQAQQAMDAAQVAFPLTLIDAQDRTVRLVKEGGTWVVCG